MRYRRGISIVDIAVLVVMVAILIALWSKTLASANNRRGMFQCMYNLRNIHMAIQSYSAMNGGKLPRVRYSAEVGPNITGDGAAAKSPFNNDGPPANNVPAALFLLLRTQDIAPSWFICPGGAYVPDPVQDPGVRSNFTDVKKNLGYSFMYTYQDVKGWNTGLGIVVGADMNPGTTGKDDNALIDNPNAAPAELRKGNSNSHGKRGQYVLFDDGRVDWYTHPFAGINGDNIYSTRKKTVVDTPADANDALLLPTDD